LHLAYDIQSTTFVGTKTSLQRLMKLLDNSRF